MCNLTFHEVVEVAVVGAVVFDGIPGLGDGHGLETELRMSYTIYRLHRIRGRQRETVMGNKTETIKENILQ